MSAKTNLPLAEMLSGHCGVDEGLILIKRWLISENPQSLRHPLGFYVALLDRSPDVEWRFHLWPKGPRRITGMPAFVHTHDCIIESRPLSGTLTNIVYDVTEVADNGQPLYQVGYSADRYSPETRNWLENTGLRVVASSRVVTEVLTGATYSVDAGDFHEAKISENIHAATLVKMTARKRSAVYVVGLDGYAPRIDFVRMVATGQEIAECI